VGVAWAPATFEVAAPVALALGEAEAGAVCEGRAVVVGEGGTAVGEGEAVGTGVTCCVVTEAPALVWPSAPWGWTAKAMMTMSTTTPAGMANCGFFSHVTAAGGMSGGGGSGRCCTDSPYGPRARG
jgi:hypothetical protein